MVGARGFEPPTTCTPCRYATRLRYASNALILSGAQAVQQFLQFALERGNVSRSASCGRSAAGCGMRTRGARLVVPVVAGGRIVKAIARPADGEAFFVKQLADAPDEQDFVVLVVAAVAAALDRF